ncbi:cobalt-precorrin 5A hydrolase [Xenorhabdus nematophila]|uniref:cobalt-precorrin 5A hydrolase n=1 Tax=Xenorhabdus nematophila TaxID=628 RepID=UPI000543ADFF|nr:cobalt-precorrin 5A hydrolase [Xenorhabdus nematophila]CEF30761.1 Protein cbiG [Xenorhabdus nematophila str. Websteri]AYA40817.1 cobalt-precorrin 5A hydrolase [Xenorhabdus nematophila]MBA0019567.1 cobalt-precorrin 5A hydrolase [Xenorhabdus nematophila]MCB4423923.1 cobalt-precorrin 5A hydrolase [Xenorhabdus nematophila]QNJ35235.1 cobalt-precorrin 5A hydrolase [Xenorhabdus nematophila]
MNTATPEKSVPKKACALFCLTAGGIALAQRLRACLEMACFTSPELAEIGFTAFDGTFANTVRKAFLQYEALIMIGATGIAIRVIAPLLRDKMADPAVVVLDEKGQFAISLLSGHMGGANELAQQIADILDSQAVITTATDVNQLAALDVLSQQVDGEIENFRASTKTVNQMLVNGQRVGIWWHPALRCEKARYDTRGFIPVDDFNHLPELDALVYVSYEREALKLAIPVFKLVPRRVVAGIGCRRGVETERVAQLLERHLAEYRLDPLALKAIGSVELKKAEPALIQLAQKRQIPFQIFSVNQLAQCEQAFPSSDFVRKTVGIGCVSQPVAWLMSQGHLVGHTLREQGVTITLGVLHPC